VLHKPDKTLIEADMMFNLPAHEQYSRSGESATGGLWTRMFIAMQNTTGPATWQKRFLWYVASMGDRQGFAQSVKRINGWDFDRIVPCHGDVIETGAKGIFQVSWIISPFVRIDVDQWPESHGVASRCGEELNEGVYYYRIKIG